MIRIKILVILSLVSLSQAFAQDDNQDFRIVENLAKNIIWIDEKDSARFGGVVDGKSNCANLVLNLSKQVKYQLHVQGRTPFYTFVDGVLLEESSISLITRLDNLYRKTLDDSVLMSFYFPDEISKSDIEIYLVDVGEVVQNNRSFMPIVKRNIKSAYGDFFIFSLSILMFFLGVLKFFYQKFFVQLLSLSRIFAVRLRGAESSGMNIFIRPAFGFTFFYSLCLSYVLININAHYSFYDMDGFGFWALVFTWITLSAFIMACLAGKYMLSMLFEQLFKMKNLPNIQSLESIKILLWFTLISMFAQWVSSMSWGKWISPNQILVTLIAGYLLKCTLIYLKSDRYLKYKKVYLFSYLCATEVAPVFLLFAIINQ